MPSDLLNECVRLFQIVLINVAWTVDNFERYSKLCEEVADVELLSFLNPICEQISVAQGTLDHESSLIGW